MQHRATVVPATSKLDRRFNFNKACQVDEDKYTHNASGRELKRNTSNTYNVSLEFVRKKVSEEDKHRLTKDIGTGYAR